MMMRQEFILCKDGESFDERLNTALRNGATVVPWTIAIQETDSGRQWFSCVVEYEVTPHGSESLPDLEDDDPEDEAGKLASIDKLMMGLAAAANSEYVQLEHNYHTGDWWVSIGDEQAVEPMSRLRPSPYLALAEAIKRVTPSHAQEYKPEDEAMKRSFVRAHVKNIKNLMIELAAAYKNKPDDGVIYLGYGEDAGEWSVYCGHRYIPDSTNADPYRSLAAAIKHVTKDVL